MSDTKQLLERAWRQAPQPDRVMDSLIRRRDRKRRNKRITAGVVGIAVFVAAVWIVTNGLSLDRSTPAVPGSKTGPAETAPPPARASAAPDGSQEGPCSGESGWGLELEDSGDRIKVRFVVRNSQDHRWRIVLRHGRAGPELFGYGDGRVFVDGIRTSRFLFTRIVVQRQVRDLEGDDGFAAKAVDQQTGQVCKALGVI